MAEQYFEKYSKGYWLAGQDDTLFAGGFVQASIQFEVPTSNTIIRLKKISLRCVLRTGATLKGQATSVFCELTSVENVIPPLGLAIPPIAEIHFGQVHGPYTDLNYDIPLDVNKRFSIGVGTYDDSWSVAPGVGDTRTTKIMVYVEEVLTRFIGF